VLNGESFGGRLTRRGIFGIDVGSCAVDVLVDGGLEGSGSGGWPWTCWRVTGEDDKLKADAVVCLDLGEWDSEVRGVSASLIFENRLVLGGVEAMGSLPDVAD